MLNAVQTRIISNLSENFANRLSHSDGKTYLEHLDFGSHMRFVQSNHSPVQLMTERISA